MYDRGPVVNKPPGHTCPAIDRALSAGRRLARLAGPSCEAEARALVDALEVVRAENAQMRAAHAEAVERVTGG